MESTLLVAGIVCLIGAIVGGGLKAFQIELPLLQSLPRQVVLGCLGAVLIAGALVLKESQPRSGETRASAEPAATGSSKLPTGLAADNGMVDLGPAPGSNFIQSPVIDSIYVPSENTPVTVASGRPLHLWSDIPGPGSSARDLGTIPVGTKLFVKQRERHGAASEVWAKVLVCVAGETNVCGASAP